LRRLLLLLLLLLRRLLLLMLLLFVKLCLLLLLLLRRLLLQLLAVAFAASLCEALSARDLSTSVETARKNQNLRLVRCPLGCPFHWDYNI
jgi:hypothetical protein